MSCSRDNEYQKVDNTSQSHGFRSNCGTVALEHEEKRGLSSAHDNERALTQNLIEEVCNPKNLNRAYKKVKSNKGSAGIDKLTVREMSSWIAENKEKLISSLLEGTYRPQAVKGVEIPKASGGVRQLGIPTVIDRLVQQAIHQVIEPILEKTFSDFSYGFRPKKSAHQAIKQGAEYVSEGRGIVIDIDLSKFFDRVNHDILMSRLARHIEDKALLKLVRKFLEAGIMKNGVYQRRKEGTPQGGPLSPILANVILTDLDMELERRGHKFCRYADDCNIYVGSISAGERVKTSITNFIEQKLKLKVNEEKSKVSHVNQRKFLGYRIASDGILVIAPESVKRLKCKIKEITKRNRGVSFSQVLKEVNNLITGWVTYFRYAQKATLIRDLSGWIRRKLRCYILKQKKRAYTIAKFLIKLGVSEWNAWITANSGKGWWRLSASPSVHHALSNKWFKNMGYIDPFERYRALQN